MLDPKNQLRCATIANTLVLPAAAFHAASGCPPLLMATQAFSLLEIPNWVVKLFVAVVVIDSTYQKT
jgi:hypothetical protein